MKIREATVITIKAAITDPFFDIKLTVSQPLGYEVSLSNKNLQQFGKRQFVRDKNTHWNASKFALFIEKENPHT